MGRTDFDRNEILLNPDLSRDELRATLAHELKHLERGPVEQRWAEQEEVAVRVQTARELVPDPPDMHMLGRRLTPYEIMLLSQLYGVDPDTLVTASRLNWPSRVHRRDNVA